MFSDYLDLIVGSDSADKSSRLWLCQDRELVGFSCRGPEVFLPVLESLNRQIHLE